MSYMNDMDKFDIQAFQHDLIGWFKKEQRVLPWRADQDPYKVWVSEIMLQQTRVETVIPFFNRFIEWFPNLEDFADADEEKILKAWEGLGYYSRVRNLQAACREVKEQYGGVVPDKPEEIISLKGVGPYTAGAILSIAYGVPEPAVDGNVMRVLSRILLIKEDIAKPRTRKIFEEAVRAIISHEDPSSFNQALMELGALICVPGKPACLLCPVNEHCAAFAQGIQNELPVKNVVKKTKKVSLTAGIIVNGQGEILIKKRPATGLLANLWEFPNFSPASGKGNEGKQFAEWFAAQFQCEIEIQPEKFADVHHVFSHLVWDIEAFSGKAVQDIPQNQMEKYRLKWVSAKEMAAMAFPVPFQKMLQAYKELQ